MTAASLSRRFAAELWEHDGPAAWFFVTLPHDVSDEIDEATAPALAGRAGFGSVRVEVTIGRTTWRTSVFPDAERRAYVLPVKQAVRSAERLADGDRVDVAITVRPGEV